MTRQVVKIDQLEILSKTAENYPRPLFRLSINEHGSVYLNTVNFKKVPFLTKRTLFSTKRTVTKIWTSKNWFKNWFGPETGPKLVKVSLKTGSVRKLVQDWFEPIQKLVQT